VGDLHPSDDHAADLSHVREVHDVVDNLRRLLVRASEADEAAIQAQEAAGRTGRSGADSGAAPNDQSPPGR